MHVLFWCGVAGFFVLYFGRGAASYPQSLLFVALLLPVAMATTYVLTGILVPRFLLPGRVGRFALYTVYTLVVSVYLELVVLIVAFVVLAGYEIEAMNPATLDVWGLVVGLYLVVALALAADLALRRHRLQAAHTQMRQAHLEAELQLREAELARFKAQMQPHFLFNTLNNLYGLALEGAPQTPAVVLRLADLLDYVLYRCDGPLVPLRGEVEHIQTYLDLEGLRYDPDRVAVTFDVPESLPEVCVAPLLLVPLVENAFKHGVHGGGQAWVRLTLALDGDALQFTVENSVPAGPASRGEEASPSAGSGIGLANVRRRLALLYPDRHALLLEPGPDRFRAVLTVPFHGCADGDVSSSASSLSSPAPAA